MNIESPNFENKIKEYASLLQDNKMLARIVDTDFVYKEIAYHAICKTRYQTRADQVKKSKVIQTRKTSIWHRSRSIHWKHLKSICLLIQEEIIERNEVFLTNDLSDQYIAIHSERSGEQDPLTTSTTQERNTLRRKYKSKSVKQEEEIWSIATIQQLKRLSERKVNKKQNSTLCEMKSTTYYQKT